MLPQELEKHENQQLPSARIDKKAPYSSLHKVHPTNNKWQIIGEKLAQSIQSDKLEEVLFCLD